MKSLIFILITLLFSVISFAMNSNDSVKSKTNEQKIESKQIYTCPMHPEIRWTKQDVCPECGMDLVPLKDATSNSHDGMMGMHGMMSSSWMYVIMGSMLLVMILLKVIK